MSVVTDVVLVYCDEDRRVVDDLQLADDTGEQRLVDVTDAANEGMTGPSRKVLSTCVAATAVNYLRVEQLVARVEAAPWEAPERVLLLVRKEDEERPAVWGFAGALYFGCVDEPRKFVCLVSAVRS